MTTFRAADRLRWHSSPRWTRSVPVNGRSASVVAQSPPRKRPAGAGLGPGGQPPRAGPGRNPWMAAAKE